MGERTNVRSKEKKKKKSRRRREKEEGKGEVYEIGIRVAMK